MKVDERAIEAAYKRGMQWAWENGMSVTTGEMNKAAYDYADKALASLPGAGAGEPVGYLTGDAGFAGAKYVSSVTAQDFNGDAVAMHKYAKAHDWAPLYASPAPASLPSEEEIADALLETGIAIGSSKWSDEAYIDATVLARAVLALLSPEGK